MIYSFNEFQLDTRLFELRNQGALIPLEPQIYNVLAYLLDNRDRIVSKQELLETLWEGKIVAESSLTTCIKDARKAIGDNGQDQHTIATIHRRGYRFVADIEANTDTGDHKGTGHQLDPPPEETRIESSCLNSIDDLLSLVVIPFSHNQGDEDAAWWADVFSEDISIHLARISGIMVISRHSVMMLEGEPNSQHIGQTLGTQYVIEGSVWKYKDEYRISVQLIDTKSGQLLWANRKRLSVENIHAFQTDVVQKIVTQIEPELNRAELRVMQHRKPVDMGAWSLCREASATLAQQGWSETTFPAVADILREAIRRDPELAFAHAYLSLIIALGHLIGLIHQSDWKEESIQAAETALALDNQDSDVLGHTGCAFADMGDFTRGIPLMKRALEINPGNAQAWAAMGSAKLRSGDESGVEDMRHGLKISPRDARVAAWGALLAHGLLHYGRLDEAIEAARHACLYDDKIFLPRVVLTIALSSKAESEAAMTAWQDARRIRPELNIDKIRWMAGPEQLQQLENMGIR